MIYDEGEFTMNRSHFTNDKGQPTARSWPAMTVGLALLVALGGPGCGGGGGFFPESIDQTFLATNANNNSVSGQISSASGVTNVTVTLFSNGSATSTPTKVGTATPNSNGAYSFSNLANGSYTIVVGGSGTRNQTDNFEVTGGQNAVLNYSPTALTGAPSNQEVEGFSALAAHMVRAVGGMRAAVPLASEVFSANVRETARALTSAPTLGTVTNISVPNADGVAVDGNGHVWVATSAGAGTALLSNTGSLLGQFFSGSLGAQTGLIAVDSANDVVVGSNDSQTVAVFPAGNTTADIGTALGTLPHISVVAQNGAITIGTDNFSTPHFLLLSNDGPSIITDTAEGFGGDSAGNGDSTDGAQAIAVDTSNNMWFGFLDTTKGAPGLFEDNPTGQTFTQFVNLGTVAGLPSSATINAMVFDSNNNLFIATSDSSLPVIKLTNGTTLAASVNGTTATTLFPNGANSLAVDSNGNVWATAQGTDQAVVFDNNLANAQAVTTLADPVQVAVDKNGNAFIAGTNGITRVTVGSPVTPPNGNTTFTLPDGSQVTVTVANGITTVTQVFPGGAPTSTFSFGSTTNANGANSLTINSTSPYGPTAGQTVISENTTTGVITYTTNTISAYDGIQTASTTTVNADGSESVTGSMSNGDDFTGTFSTPDPTTGDVTMTGSYVDATTGANVTVTANFNSDGSISSYTVNNVTAGLSATGALSNTGSFSESVTQTGSSTVLATGTDDQLQDILIGVSTATTITSNSFSVTNLSAPDGNVYTQGLNISFTGGGTTTITGSQFNDQTTSGSGNVTPGQGDGNAADSGTGQGNYLASDGSGSGGSVRGITK
jgi:sugar lactone lactonase YvrE